MTIRPLTDDISVSAQIAIEDLQAIKDQGFNSLIICRPDGEENQPSFAEVAEAASAVGMETAYAPLVMGENPMEALAAFDKGMAQLTGPTLGYCKSGMRVAMLWALSQRGKMSADDILTATTGAGFDLSRIRPLLGS